LLTLSMRLSAKKAPIIQGSARTLKITAKPLTLMKTKKNIIGESSTNVKGYAPQGTVEPYYAYEGDPLYEHLDTIINARATGSSLNTTVVDVQIDSTGKIKWAYREDAVVVPQSRGGSDGVQIPFEIYYNGNRTEGTFALATKSFTPKTNNES